MSSIAMFPCKYTPVAGVIGELSTALELQIYADEKFIADTATEHNVHPDKIKEMMYGKTSVFNQFTLERELMVNRMRSVLAEVLDTHTAYLFHGFFTLLIPQRIAHVLKVLVVNKKQSRIDRAVLEGMSLKEAKRAVRNHDFSAYSWSDFLFQKEAYDKSLYDLVIPAAGKKQEELVDEITKRYHTTSVLRTAESQRAIDDFKIEVEVERILLNNGHKVKVSVEEGRINLVVQKSVYNFNRLVEELSELAAKAGGAGQVNVTRGADYNESIYRRQKFELPSKVLFVDDEKEFVQTVAQRLISRDVGTYGVYNGSDALDLIAEDRPDIMVLDLKMPGLHGIEVLRRTKELAPEVEVIILTGHGTNEDMEKCMKFGAFAYMNKPVDIEELSETIKKANEKLHGNAFDSNQIKKVEQIRGAN
ncbi:response regulator [Desulfopila inferna]|uniref:response regulator n=1 Tax=Desulfopila inferna TaxID=468528 RepID=UPI00196378E8|nr:response regulator [Desulfopila inferna]MBM9603049.1 response regulator [Desulfopila inferna]